MSAPDGAFAIDVITLFPEFFPGPLATGLSGRALREARAEVRFLDFRRFTRDRHRSVDDAPYGGGAGMVLKVEPLFEAIQVIRGRGSGPVVLLSPQGRPLVQADLVRWAEHERGHLGLVCGRYEGFDERVRTLVDEEVSLGDFVLTGGEPAALVVIDGVIRLLPGTLGNEDSAPSDSFSDGLLEHPQYTRPEVHQAGRVPQVLLGGNHRQIEGWQREQKLLRTRRRRPELLEGCLLPLFDRAFLARTPSEHRLFLAVEVSDPTDADVVRLARLAYAYRIEMAFLVSELAEARLQTSRPVECRNLPGLRKRDPVSRFLLSPKERVCGLGTWRDLPDKLPLGVPIFSAGRESGMQAFSPAQLRREARSDAGMCLVVGAAAECWAGVLPGVRQYNSSDVLDPLTEAAILLDRVLSEG